MAKLTQYADIIVPESFDIADEPRALCNMALGIDAAWGGEWQDFTPLVSQGATDTVYLTLSASSVARVKKIGATVYVVAYLLVAAGTGNTGAPTIFLPYPAFSVHEPLGHLIDNRGSATAPSVCQYGVVSAGTASQPTATDRLAAIQTNSRAANDWFGLHFCYETGVV